ncbi:MAG: hypothetical protein AAFW73_23460 [Bacteroidota bacterium]
MQHYSIPKLTGFKTWFEGLSTKTKKIIFYTSLLLTIFMSILATRWLLKSFGQPTPIPNPPPAYNPVAERMQDIEMAFEFDLYQHVNSRENLLRGMKKLISLAQALERPLLITHPNEFSQYHSQEWALQYLASVSRRMREQYCQLLKDGDHPVYNTHNCKACFSCSISRESFDKNTLRFYHKDLGDTEGLKEEILKTLWEDLRLLDFKMLALYEYRRGERSPQVGLYELQEKIIMP